MNNWKLSVVLVAIFFSVNGMAAPENFGSAKKAARAIYADHPVSFYCGYHINWTHGTSGVLDMPGYKVRKDPVRARRVEYEHIMPAHNFGQHMQCWKNGGRKACQNDPAFTRIEADLHNLAPASGEVNADRSNYRYGMVTGQYWSYGSCKMKVDGEQRVAEPPDTVKGDVARVYFYMRDRYGINLSVAQERLYAAWDRQDAVDAWEQERDRRISRYMGHSNPYVSKDGLVGVKGKPAASAAQIAPTASVLGNPRSKIAHANGCPNYPDMVVNSSAVPFRSVEEAIQAGYRMANNCHLK